MEVTWCAILAFSTFGKWTCIPLSGSSPGHRHAHRDRQRGMFAVAALSVCLSVCPPSSALVCVCTVGTFEHECLFFLWCGDGGQIGAELTNVTTQDGHVQRHPQLHTYIHTQPEIAAT
mmetsp:Transcript_21936/g.62458  ORF Transcript_21936/g.62458 Transcript_21936/m.62458 type:complete len:118 (+) Transcript_21936:2013-2366(+)